MKAAYLNATLLTRPGLNPLVRLVLMTASRSGNRGRA